MSLTVAPDLSSAAIRRLVDEARGDILFLAHPHVHVEPRHRMLDRMRRVMEDTGAGIVYADSAFHPRIDYQPGSLRDTFDLGPVVAISVPAARAAGLGGDRRWGGLYDLRLRISERLPVVRIPEPLYTYAASAPDARRTGEKQFDYVDPKNRDYQVEMEEIATEHLKRTGAWLPPEFAPFRPNGERFEVEASVVIPVRNRERTIADAVRSALSQVADFPFNVIVVDNHSTDRTTEVLRGITDRRLVHLVPERTGHGIGGCWNEAIFSERCGRWAVQLDSDDLYAGETALARLHAELRSGPYAMVIGAYTMVSFTLQVVAPGLVDHREWTRENGRNNALRIGGLGAPRAFATSVARRFGFPDVSYGEDYAMGLRLSREYEIGRVYEPLYLCRRWEGNSDAALPLETANRYDSYKDWLRTNEILARRRR